MKDSPAEVQLANPAKDLTYAEMEQLMKDWPVGKETEDVYDYADGQL